MYGTGQLSQLCNIANYSQLIEVCMCVCLCVCVYVVYWLKLLCKYKPNFFSVSRISQVHLFPVIMWLLLSTSETLLDLNMQIIKLWYMTGNMKVLNVSNKKWIDSYRVARRLLNWWPISFSIGSSINQKGVLSLSPHAIITDVTDSDYPPSKKAPVLT